MDIDKIMNEISSLDDDVSKAEQYNDLAFDAEMASDNKREEAKEIFLALYNTLDRNNDLFYTAYDVAEKFLMKWGVISPPSAKQIETTYLNEYNYLKEYEQHLAVATNLSQYKYISKDILELAIKHIESAKEIKPISRKHQRLLIELKQKYGNY